MGKRSNFERNPRDLYITPEKPVYPLLKHLQPGTLFDEPCAGDRSLVRHLEKFGHKCQLASDILPQAEGIITLDAMKIRPDTAFAGLIITNTPWDRSILHPMIEHFRTISPAWLLLDADYMHTKQAIPYLDYCDRIVSVGRVRWQPNTKMDGKDNCCWYRFLQHKSFPVFFPRTDSAPTVPECPNQTSSAAPSLPCPPLG